MSSAVPAAAMSRASISASHAPNETFRVMIEESPFEIFKPLFDLGFYTWNPSGGYKNVKDVSTSDITARITFTGQPQTVVSPRILNAELPTRFRSLTPRTHENRFPYDSTYMTPIYVAVKDRKMQIDEIDFVFGGSTLEFLATGTHPSNSDAKYLTTTIHIMDISGNRVLFAADCDSVDQEGNPIEIKSSNERYWGTKLMFQMVSNGSTSVYAGRKVRGQLESVRIVSLSNIIVKAIYGGSNSVEDLEENILNGIHKLKDAGEQGELEGKTMEIHFEGNELHLRKFATQHLLLPPPAVVNDLLVSERLAKKI